MRKFLFFLSFVCVSIAHGHTQSLEIQTETNYITLDSLDRYMQDMLDEWGMPGMAVAIVYDGEVILSKGYGSKVYLDFDQPVDEHTNFQIASLSKAFTAAALAILVDEGKLSWEDKVIDHLPWFQLEDPYVTANMTIRDLLCHRAGYETFSGDLLWFETTYDRDEVVRRARYLEPVYGFREHFGYSNIMYIAAGQVVEAVSGQTWDDFVATHFFEPLGMERTHTYDSLRWVVGNTATPHSTISGFPRKIEYMNWDNVAAAGGVNSNVDDMAAWIQLWLDKGIHGEDTIFSPARMYEMWTLNTPQDVSPGSRRLWPSTHFSGYGMGWNLKDYKGVEVISHSGGTDGMTTFLALVPERKFGFVILTNAYSSFYYPMAYTILDKFLGSNGTDWGSTFLSYDRRRKKMQQEADDEYAAARHKGTRPSLDLEAYTGTYGGDLYGTVQVKVEGEGLLLHFDPAPGLDAKLTHWHYDTFRLKFKDLESLPEGNVNFILSPEGKVEELRIDVPNPDFDFTELEFKKMSE